MTDITEWWGNLMLVQQICLVIAVPATVILLIQTMMLLFGMDEEFNSDADASLDDGLTLFSVRGIVSMLCITGWSGYALLETPLPEWASVLIAVVLGIATLLVMAFLMRALQRLQSSGNIEIANAVGKVGQVYIGISTKHDTVVYSFEFGGYRETIREQAVRTAMQLAIKEINDRWKK